MSTLSCHWSFLTSSGLRRLSSISLGGRFRTHTLQGSLPKGSTTSHRGELSQEFEWGTGAHRDACVPTSDGTFPPAAE